MASLSTSSRPPSASWRGLLGFPDGDPRTRAGRLGALLLLVTAAAATLASPVLPGGVSAGPLHALTALGLMAGVTCLLWNWELHPRYWTLAPAAAVLLALIVGSLFEPRALARVAPLAVLAFLHLGLTQRPRVPASLGVASLTLLALLQGLGPVEGAFGLAASTVGGTVAGELVARLEARAARAQRRADALLVSLTRLSTATGTGTAAETVVGLVSRLLETDGVLVLLLRKSPGSALLVDAARRGAPGARGSLVLDAGNSGFGSLLAETSTRLHPDATALYGGELHRLGASSAVTVPLHGEGGALGVVVGWWRTRRVELDEGVEQVGDVVGRQAGAILERLRAVDALAAEARTDPLTGVANRRAFLTALEASRPGAVVAVLDLDHFKELNDTRGHAAGDEVLVAFARLLATGLREGDCAARWGGEEFALVLEHGGIESAERALARLRESWAAAGAPVTFSAGLAVIGATETRAQTVARADAALYRAKRTGRDRTERCGQRSEDGHVPHFGVGHP